MAHDDKRVTEGFGLPAFLYSSIDLRVVARIYGGWTRWALGFHVDGLTLCRDAVEIAKRAGHRFGLAFAHVLYAHLVNECRTDLTAARDAEEYTKGAAFDYDYWSAYSTILRGWANRRAGRVVEARRQLSDGIRAFARTEAGIQRPYLLTLEAEAGLESGDRDSANRLLTSAEGLVGIGPVGAAVRSVRDPGRVRRGQVRWGDNTHVSEIYRVRGHWHVKGKDLDAAKKCFDSARKAAMKRSARALELRALSELVGLPSRQGRADGVREEFLDLWRWFWRDEEGPKLGKDGRWREENLNITDLVAAERLAERLGWTTSARKAKRNRSGRR